MSNAIKELKVTERFATKDYSFVEITVTTDAEGTKEAIAKILQNIREGFHGKVLGDFDVDFNQSSKSDSSSEVKKTRKSRVKANEEATAEAEFELSNSSGEETGDSSNQTITNPETEEKRPKRVKKLKLSPFDMSNPSHKALVTEFLSAHDNNYKAHKTAMVATAKTMQGMGFVDENGVVSEEFKSEFLKSYDTIK